ncbi:helix-turn-helix domain-containing protein [Paenibacillus sp. EKM202P]|uniref:response regulator n=1 Tax=unclassified Paenibacillus TaxID=185978 RepID=UPI0013EBC941|nr:MULTISPECIES: helix-turn-helix domain-containing protein [unclassified Paenibacillus]KAF6565781.1 helix-turn-helix domain-containing protein [Paenibacillus sp. EKM202P]KAF6572476.1 helix-turn-helix domain-containing protein [Paenibacillus sp. EKM207P]
MYRLLIVDDEYHIREGLRLMVAESDLSVEVSDVAGDGATALRLYMERRPDIILLDINLPDMSGLDIAKTIREKDQQTPLLFLTGYESMTYIRQAVSLQAVDYLLKPVTSEDFEAALRRSEDRIAQWRRSEEEAIHRHRSLEPLYREHLLLDLLQQRRPAAEVIQEMDGLGFFAEASGPPYTVLCCELEEAPQQETAATSNTPHGSMYGSSHVFAGLAEEAAVAAGAKAHSTAVSRDRRVVLLATASCRAAERTAQQIRQAVQERLSQGMSIGISRPVQRMEQLSEAYEQAVQAAEHRGWVGYSQIIPYESIQAAEPNSSQLLEKELLMITEIRAGNDAAVHAILQEWSGQLAGLPVNQVKMIVTQLVLFVMRIVQSDAFEGQTSIQEQDPLLELSRLRHGPEMIDYVSRYFVRVGRQVRESREKGIPRKFQRAKEWIREHLQEDGGLNRLAEYMNMSPKYLSARFKQVTGESFADYQTRVRFERARELLLDPNRKVAEVAEAVGFADTNYFSIAFKKHTGLTPTEFRKTFL